MTFLSETGFFFLTIGLVQFGAIALIHIKVLAVLVISFTHAKKDNNVLAV